MTSRLKLKRKKFEEPYKDGPNQMTSRLKLTKKKGRPPNAQIENVCGEKYKKSETKGNNSNEMKLETPKIFQSAIASAQKHKIKLTPGRKNHSDGNCSYESVIFNINDRSCFIDKLPMSPDYYRIVWNTDMMNRILDERIPWNPGMTRSEIVRGFQELMNSGVYERSYFGDMMIAGIACGVKKRILIFNTNENTGHDPIAVVDPTHYGGETDSEIPVVVAYNLVHYESLHPVGEKDIEETIKLVRSYTAEPSRYGEEYGYARNDISYLINPDNIQTAVDKFLQTEFEIPHSGQIQMNDPESSKITDKTSII